MLRTSDLGYHLPAGRVAATPAAPRDSARMMILSRSNPERIDHVLVRDLPDFLRTGDLLVRNETRVMPARLLGAKPGTGGVVVGLFLQEERAASQGAPAQWRVMLKGGRLRVGSTIDLRDASHRSTGVRLTLRSRADEGWIVGVEGAEPGVEAATILDRLGATPLPPYILAARREARDGVPDEVDRARYQTVYAAPDRSGSVAAPTAGLHFTPELLARLGARGVRTCAVTLHVGFGTFKPVETEFVEEHNMHEEWRDAPAETLRAARETRAAGGRIIAVGTTSVRALESVSTEEEASCGVVGAPGVQGPTRLLITPGFHFRRIDALLTNFHLPRSTLLALVAAFLEPPQADGGGVATGRGVERLTRAYAVAIDAGYRFYSYGDAMLILP